MTDFDKLATINTEIENLEKEKEKLFVKIKSENLERVSVFIYNHNIQFGDLVSVTYNLNNKTKTEKLYYNGFGFLCDGIKLEDILVVFNKVNYDGSVSNFQIKIAFDIIVNIEKCFRIATDKKLIAKLENIWYNDNRCFELSLILSALIHRDSSIIFEQCDIEIGEYENDTDMVEEIGELYLREIATNEDLKLIVDFIGL